MTKYCNSLSMSKLNGGGISPFCVCGLQSVLLGVCRGDAFLCLMLNDKFTMYNAQFTMN